MDILETIKAKNQAPQRRLKVIEDKFKVKRQEGKLFN